MTTDILISIAEQKRSRYQQQAAHERRLARTVARARPASAAGPRHRRGVVLLLVGTRLQPTIP